MRRSRVVVALCLVALGLGWWLTQSPWTGSAAVGAPVTATAGDPHKLAAQPHRPARFDPAEWQLPAVSAAELATPGGTPALKNPATAADGFLELRVSANGRPSADAHVRLYLRGPREPGTGGSQWRFAGGGATDPAGQLRIAARPGTYLVAVRHEGFAPARREVLRPAGEAVTRVEVSLESGSVLRGRIVESGGAEPVPLAQLSLSRFTAAGSGRTDAPSEETVFGSADARGHFELTGLEPGTYRLEASAPGRGKATRRLTLPRSSELVVELGAATTVEGRVLAEGGGPAAGAEVAIVGGPEVVTTTTGPEGTFATEVTPGPLVVSARLGSQTGSVSRAVASGATARDVVIQLGAGAGIEGVVQSKATHAPVAAAKVILTPFGGEGDLGHAVTSDDGHFAVAPLAAGPYDVEVYAEGFSPYARTGVTVSAGQRFPLVLELDGTGSISGIVRDERGAPAPGLLIQGVRMWGSSAYTWGATHEARTGADGSYRLTDVELGRVRVSAGHSPEPWLAQQLVDVKVGQEAHADLTIRELGTLTGRVTGKSGAPLQVEAVVRVIPDTGGAISGGDIRQAPVGQDGRYRIELPAGRYRLFPFQADRTTRSNPAPVGVTLEPGGTTERDLELVDAPSQSLVEGTVLEPDGSPSPFAMVQVAESAQGGTGKALTVMSTDERGHFAIPKLGTSEPALLDLVARHGGRLGQLKGVRRGSTDAVVPMQAGGVVSGRVEGIDPGAGFHVSYRVLDTTLIPWLSQDTQEFSGGVFALAEVPATPIRVVVSAEGGRTGTADITVPVGGTASVTVMLEASAKLLGRLVDGAKPIAGGLVRIDGRSATVPTAADGSFECADVTAGTHLVAAWAPGYASLERSVTVSAGQQLDLGDVALARRKADPGTIGVSWAQPSAEVVALSVLPDGPADRAGLRAGDVLTAVDGAAVATAQEAEAKTTGAPGSTTRLTLRRGQDLLQLDVVRAPSAPAPKPQKRSGATAAGSTLASSVR